MAEYAIKRVVLAIPTLLLVGLIIFVIMRAIPGDAALLMSLSGEEVSAEADEKLYEELRHKFGLDRPVVVQYADWVWRFVRYGDLGNSYWSDRPVVQQLVERLPVTLELAVGSIIIAVSLAIPWGVAAALWRDRLGDYVPRVVSVILVSMPNFWIGTLLVVFPAILLKYSAPLGYINPLDNLAGNLQQFIFPWIAVGARLIGTSLRMTRSSMLEVLSQDYIRTAWAKGLPARTVLFVHALKNAMIPVITIIGGQIAFLLGGAVIIEAVFGLPGLGSLTIESIRQRDYPQTQASVMFIAMMVLAANLIVDLSYAYFDPRIKYR